MFNALKYTEILENAGFTREQAEKSIKVLIEIMETNLATKQDVLDLTNSQKNELKLLEHRMTIKLGTMLAATIAIITALNKLL